MDNSEYLTPAQNTILKYIDNYIHDNGLSPTLREIAEKLGKSIITIYEHIECLKDKGFIYKTKFKSRSIRVIQCHDNYQGALNLNKRLYGQINNKDDLIAKYKTVLKRVCMERDRWRKRYLIMVINEE